MNLNTELPSTLSGLFVNDLRASQYYLQLTADERTSLEDRLTKDAAPRRAALPEDVVALYLNRRQP